MKVTVQHRVAALIHCSMPEFVLSERIENAHEEPIWAVTHVKEDIFATGSLDESVKLWWVSAMLILHLTCSMRARDVFSSIRAPQAVRAWCRRGC